MKQNFFAAALLVALGLASCNGTGTSGTSDTTSKSTTMNPGDSSVTTTTTTVHHRYSGTFVPKADTKYLDLKTHKEVIVRIDTVKGTVVNSETDEPIDLLVEPATHDTVYVPTGNIVNNYVIHDPNGDVRVDTLRINTTDTVHEIAPAQTTDAGKYKEKGNGKTKFKSDDEKTVDKGDKMRSKVK